MKQLTDKDICDMVNVDFVPSGDATSVRRELHLSKKIPQPHITPEHIVLDWHQHTEQQAWDMVMDVAKSGIRTATIITGASGILKTKLQQWVDDSLLSPYVISCVPLNNGSFEVRFKKQK